MSNQFDIAQSVKNSSTLCTEEVLARLLTSRQVANVINEIREIETRTYHPGMTDDDWAAYKDAIKGLKTELPVALFHAHFKNGTRRGEFAEESPWVTYDYDHLDNPREFFLQHIEPHIDEYHLVMVYISPSLHGLKIVGQLPSGMTRQQAQKWMDQQLGLHGDSTHDLARCAFLVPTSLQLLYRPSRLFADEVEPWHPRRYDVDEIEDAVIISEEVTTTDLVPRKASEVDVPTYKGIPLKDIRDQILLRDGFPLTPRQGERNNAVMTVARKLAQLDCDVATLEQVIPTWGLPEDEYKKTLYNALKYRPVGKLTPEMSSIIESLQPAAESDDNDSKSVKIPKNLPRAYKLILKMFPAYQHHAILAATQPLFGTLATEARIMGDDYVINGLGLQTCIVGEWGSGKDCITKLYYRIMHNLIEQDQNNRRLEEEWREAKENAINDRKQPARPHFPIRIVPPGLSKNKLLERIQDAQGKHCLIFTAEIQDIANTNAHSYAKIESTLRKAFDGEGGVDGNDTCSNQSANMMVNVRVNTLFAGTPEAVMRFYRDPEGGGPSRVLFVQLEDRLGEKRPIYKPLSATEDEELEGYIQLLQAEAHQEHPYRLPKVERALNRWQEELRQEYRNSQQDPAKLKLSYRALTNGLRAGCIAYILNGKVEDASVVNFALYIAKSCLLGGYSLFADQMNAESNREEIRQKNLRSYASPTRDLLKELPLTFSREQLAKLRAQQGNFASQDVTKVISRWKSYGLIEETPRKNYYRIVS